MPDKIRKTDEEWKEELSPEAYAVCRQKGTERAFSGEYHDCREEGDYHCACCGQPLFGSGAKFNSGTGWPSFYAPLAPDCVDTEEDMSHSMHRTEVLCSRCNSHLGHVFPDGPLPTGLRYCINSIALKMETHD